MTPLHNAITSNPLRGVDGPGCATCASAWATCSVGWPWGRRLTRSSPTTLSWRRQTSAPAWPTPPSASHTKSGCCSGKLLLGENLSRQLVPALQARFPGSSQVGLLGLEQATSAQICEHEAQHGFVICSKDNDVHRLVAARDYSPRLIHLALDNVGNGAVLAALLAATDRLQLAFDDHATGVVVIGRTKPKPALSTSPRLEGCSLGGSGARTEVARYTATPIHSSTATQLHDR